MPGSLIKLETSGSPSGIIYDSPDSFFSASLPFFFFFTAHCPLRQLLHARLADQIGDGPVAAALVASGVGQRAKVAHAGAWVGWRASLCVARVDR